MDMITRGILQLDDGATYRARLREVKGPVLEDGATYRVRFHNFNGPGEHEEVDMLHHSGYWIAGSEAYVEGPLTVEEAGYEVVGKVDGAGRLIE